MSDMTMAVRWQVVALVDDEEVGSAREGLSDDVLINAQPEHAIEYIKNAGPNSRYVLIERKFNNKEEK